MLNRWQRTIVDLRGNVVPYAQLQIRVESTQATATIYADRAGNELIPNGIVTADANGYAYFYAKADLYRISSMKPTIDWRYVDIGSANAVRIATEALDENLVTYPTLAELEADTTRDVNSMGRVVNDGSNNGYYLWNGTSWVRTSYQPMQRDEFDDLVLHVENDFLRKDIEQSAPLLRDIPQLGVVGLPYDVDQLYAQIWASRYPGFPAPSAHFEFGAGARLLSPDLTFSRPSKAWGLRNGKVVEYEIDEPVFEDGGLRLEPQATNLIRYSNDLSKEHWEKYGVDIQADGDAWRMTRTAEFEGDYAFIQSWRYFAHEHPSYRSISFVVGERSVDRIALGLYEPDPFGVNRHSFVELYDGATGGMTQSGRYEVKEIGGGRLLVSIYNYTLTSFSRIQRRVILGIPPEYTEGDYVTLSHFVGMQDTADPTRELPEWISSYISTEDEPATRAADNARIEGAAFQQIFNPQEGAVVFDVSHSWVSGGSADILNIYNAAEAFALGLTVGASSAGGLRAIVFGDYYAFEGADRLSGVPRFKLGFSWNAQEFKFFGNGAHYATAPMFAGWGDSISLTMSRVRFPSYWHSLLFFKSAPTDAEMEALTYA